MAKKGRRSATRPPSDYLWMAAGVAVAAVLLGAAVAALRVEEGEDAGDALAVFGDIHGLALDPAEPGRLYVATHNGLFVGENDAAWRRLGPPDDLMGFTAHPSESGTFWASGHPAERRPDYTNLGVRKSSDGGRTWRDLALPGVDFHSMTLSAAQPQNLWGLYQGRIHRSLDAGETWREAGAAPLQTSGLTAHPGDPDALFAAARGGIHRSADGGATWSAWSPQPALGLAWARDGARVYAAVGDAVLASDDEGRSWTRTSLAPAGTVAHLAVDPREPDVVYAATYQAAIHKSTDGGATWRLVKDAR